MKRFKEIHLNKNIITYLICAVIASILWFLNALNQEYAAELIYPVKYTNFPEGKYPAVKLPSHLQLAIKAKGFALLGYRIKTSFLPITFNVGAYNNHLVQNGDVFEYTLNTNDIKDKISSQLSNEIKLSDISPEEIVFRFATARQKKVPVYPNIHYSLKRQYILNRIIVVPDSVGVSGPSSVVDTLRMVTTAPLELKDIGKNVSRTVRLMPVENSAFSEETVDVLVEVEQFTEAKMTIPLIPLHVPDTMNIRLFPSAVNISYEVGLSKYEKITDKEFVFSVDYPQKTGATYLEVKVVKAPACIKNLSYSPQKVEYILEKK